MLRVVVLYGIDIKVAQGLGELINTCVTKGDVSFYGRKEI